MSAPASLNAENGSGNACILYVLNDLRLHLFHSIIMNIMLGELNLRVFFLYRLVILFLLLQLLSVSRDSVQLSIDSKELRNLALERS